MTSMRIRSIILSFLVTLTLLFVASCSMRLHEPEGQPLHPPEGLWIDQKGNEFDVLRISCAERCWFRSVYLSHRDLLLSGTVVHQSVRSGYLLTSPSEVLLMQTEFRSERIEWKGSSEPKVVLDRVVHGETHYRLLTWQGADQLEDDDASFRRQCSGPCSLPQAFLASLPVSPNEAVDPALSEGRSPASTSPKAPSALSKMILISPDAAMLDASSLVWPADVKPPYAGGLFSLFAGNRSVGSVPVTTKGKPDLGTLYESHISLTPGAKALDLSRKRRDDAEIKKQKKRDDIRRRLKNGEAVSKEEMLEVLE